MNKLDDDYYYLLGRKMAIVEFNGKIPKTLLHGISTSQMVDWRQGYNEMYDGLHWRRKSVKEVHRDEENRIKRLEQSIAS